ncbi:MAG: chromosome segregation protein SMC [Candidatus Aenigmarchaeota archaeon]|nr:chromosome segregation protein SMC [Candidatus Aenigmarchaeota archaeon]
MQQGEKIMVRLDRITMQGFKSFANRITIPFPSGFNVICGPNGAGKSNCVDGLLFVLGTTSARSIRAQKLQNLIFNGARDKKPADFCEVSIYIDNSDGKIPGDEKEVKITRRITRSGISIYKLNGRTVTRAKILDILSYANLSTEGYNIIMQGDVAKIIEMSSLERKGTIDEISGISEFDEKKAKATSELEKVEIRVRENMIVVAEKQKLVARLKQEKENAEKYKKISDELRKAKASLLKKKIKDVTEKQSAFDKEIDENSKNFDLLAKELSKIDGDLEKKEKGVIRKGDELIKKSRNYEILRRIDSINNEILRKRDRINFNEREMQRAKGHVVGNIAIKEILGLRHNGVYDTVSNLIDVPKKYSVAVEVAIGRHASDIVVDNDDTASFCIKHLKEKKLGRARFIPLNRIKGGKKRRYDGKIIGYAIDLIKFDRKFQTAMEYVLGNTLVVDDIDTARKIKDFRVATLDGDLVEQSGAMIGGFYKRMKQFSDSGLEAENEKLEHEIENMEKELEKLRAQEQQESAEVLRLQEAKSQEEKDLETVRKRHRELYEERMVLQNIIGRAKIEKAKLEANMDNLKTEFEDFRDVDKFFDQSIEELQERVRRCLIEINQIGPVNLKAIEEFEMTHVEFEELKRKLDSLLEEKDAVLRIVQDVEKRRYDKFMETFTEINQNFSRIYKDLTSGDGLLRLEIDNDIDSGLIIEANPSGKKILNLDSMSGGEKTLTSLGFLFAVMQHYAAPFYVLDEIDAALDKANTKKIDNLIKKYSKEVQFIVITHNDLTIAEADKVFGVSMEGGISKVFGIEMPTVRG